MNADQLNQERLTISMEFDASNFTRIGNHLSNTLGSFVASVRTFIRDIVIPTADLHFSFQLDHRLFERLQRVNYVQFTAVTCFVPTGMRSTWTDYLTALEASQDLADRLVTDVLRPSIVYFSQLVATPETLGRVAISTEEGKINFYAKEMESVKKQLASCFNKNSNVSEVPYGDVFLRHADWKTNALRLQTLSERLALVSPKQIAELVQQLTAILETLITRMRTHPDVYTPTGVTASSLARVAMGIGYEIEFYASHVYMLQVATTVMSQTVEKFQGILDA